MNPPIQKNQWVDPVTSTAQIAANPQAWVNHAVAVKATFSAPVMEPDGTWLATSISIVRRCEGYYARSGDSIAVKLSADAYAYYLERKEIRAPAVYLGEVVADPNNGTHQLMLQRGLTYALNRPFTGFPHSSAPALKAVP